MEKSWKKFVDHINNCINQPISFIGNVDEQKGVKKCLKEILEYIEITKPQPTIIFPSEEEMEEIICGQSDGIRNNEVTNELLADGVSVKVLTKKIIARIKERNQPNQF